MTKLLVQLDTDSRAHLSELQETGMGYYVVRGRLAEDRDEQVHIIGGDFFVVPESHPSFFSLSDLLAGESFPSSIGATLGMVITAAATLGASISLPPGYVPAVGAISLLGAVTLTRATVFYRFGRMVPDPRFVGGVLKKGTYLTTVSDHGYANTGFAAVARYALPLPVPASELFVYQLPPGTSLLIGTVLPNYGQAGGGVEVQLQTDVPAAPIKQLTLDDY